MAPKKLRKSGVLQNKNFTRGVELGFLGKPPRVPLCLTILSYEGGLKSYENRVSSVLKILRAQKI